MKLSVESYRILEIYCIFAAVKLRKECNLLEMSVG